MLTTERLILRHWRLRDWQPFLRMNADRLVMEHMPGPMTRWDSLLFWLHIRRHFKRNGFGLFAVETREQGRFAGFVGLMVPDIRVPFMPAVEIGWRLLPEFWGLGYATEAARAVLAYAFDTLAMEEVVSYTVPANHASWRVMQKLGMSREEADDFDHPALPTGHPRQRHVLYRISSEQFLKQQGEFQLSRVLSPAMRESA